MGDNTTAEEGKGFKVRSAIPEGWDAIGKDMESKVGEKMREIFPPNSEPTVKSPKDLHEIGQEMESKVGEAFRKGFPPQVQEPRAVGGEAPINEIKEDK